MGAGLLLATVVSAEGLREDGGLGERILTGGKSDPYVLLNVLEEGVEGLLKDAMDLAEVLDPSRSLPVAPKPGLFFGLFGKEERKPVPPSYRFSRVAVYTYGAPRIGNEAFAALVDSKLPEFFRVVNRQDIVTRLPRGGYTHFGRGILLLNRTAGDTAPGPCRTPGLWVQGQDAGRDPSDVEKKFANPFESTQLLGSIRKELEDGALAQVRGTANLIAESADELKRRLNMIPNVAQEEFTSITDNVKLTAKELQEANELAARLADQVAANPEFEQEATAAVAEKLRSALARKSHSIGDRKQASTTVSEAASIMDLVQKTGATAIESLDTARKKAVSDVERKWNAATPGELASLIGIDASYAATEVSLLKAMGNAEAVIQHLEPSYYKSMNELVQVLRTRTKGR